MTIWSEQQLLSLENGVRDLSLKVHNPDAIRYCDILSKSLAKIRDMMEMLSEVQAEFARKLSEEIVKINNMIAQEEKNGRRSQRPDSR